MAKLGLYEDGETLVPLLEWVAAGGAVEAHNAMFERAVWNHVFVPQYHVTPVKDSQWRCSAAKAASHALPRGLDGAIEALDLPFRKDTEGQNAMKRMVVPRKPIKADWLMWNRKHAPCPSCQGIGKTQLLRKDGAPRLKLSKCPVCVGRGHTLALQNVPPMPLLWLESAELMERLFVYNKADVLAERGLSAALPDLSTSEQHLYLLDQTVNDRGFQLDPEAISAAQQLIDTEFVELNKELAVLTDGQVLKATQREKMKAWFADNGLDLDDTTADTINGALGLENLLPHVRRGLELVQTLGRSSTAKYGTMADWLGPGDRVRGGLLFDGASTGRWTGKGVQPHNFPKGTLKDQEAAWAVLKTLDREQIVAFPNAKGVPYGEVMKLLSDALRGVIVAPKGKQLYVADYAAIEARVVLWLAQADDLLNIFRRGEDIYCTMASEIYARPITKADAAERQLGKVAVLGLGYQMGWAKFMESAASYGIDLDEPFARRVVDTYRRKFWQVKQLWWDTEEAAIQAVREPGSEIVEGRITWFVDDRFLYAQLPSGRRLAYADPEVRLRSTPWGEKDHLTFMGVDTYTRQWTRQHTYGGSLVENLTQAVARDVMADAMVRIEGTMDYRIVLSVHDELIAEAPLGYGSVSEFEALLTQVPRWGTGLPIGAEGWVGTRYRK